MRRVLIIGFPWPYIGGSKRVIGLAKHLPEFGWQPIILSMPLMREAPRDMWVIQTDYQCLLGTGVRFLGLNQKSDIGDQLKERVQKRLPVTKTILRWGFNLFKEIAAYPDEHKGWKAYALAAAEDVINKHCIEAIISVWPVSSHVIARDLKIKYRLLWIADLADLWSDNSAYPYSRIRKWFDRRLETRTLMDADILTTSSWPLAERLSNMHGKRRVEAIMLGFDPQIINHHTVPLRQKFTITYTGMFYPKKRDPFVFFKALQELIADQRIDPYKIEVRLYGPQQDWIQKEIENCGVSSIVRQYGEISFEACIERQQESHLLLQVNWNDINERGVFSGKFLDYLAAGQPILAVGGSGNDDVVIRILRETGAGIYAVSLDEVKRALESFYNIYQKTGMTGYKSDWRQIDEYSNRTMARKFVGLLDEALGRVQV